jgi:hypothetical protein
VEAAVAQALDGVSARDRAATRRVLGRLADHLAGPSTADAVGKEQRAPKTQP